MKMSEKGVGKTTPQSLSRPDSVDACMPHQLWIRTCGFVCLREGVGHGIPWLTSEFLGH